MNPLIFLGGGYLALIAGHYLFMRATQGIHPPDPDKVCPSISMADGCDYVASDRIVVLGHYYMSIAGLSPVLSAIAGMQWGWLPVVVWMLVGVHWMGGFTEYMHILISMRHKAKNLGSVVVEKIGIATGTYLNLILVFFCILVFAIFAFVISTTLEGTPTAVIPTLTLIPLAMLFGYLRYVKQANLGLTTLVFVVLWGIMIVLGQNVPINISWQNWLIIFVIYTFFATGLPVWSLLQPRDFLNSAILVAGIGIGTIALFIGLPSFEMPAYAGWVSPAGSLYPAIFIMVTCGAVAATHSLISMGTTSKQVANEKDTYWIASLGTKGETVIALMAITLVASYYSYDQFISEVVPAPGPAFTAAYAHAVGFIGLPEVVGATFGALILSAFVMTTMDSYARAGRYLIQEIANDFPALKATQIHRVWPSTALIVLVGWLIATYTNFMAMWAGYVAMNLFVIVYSYMMITIYTAEQRHPLNAKFFYWVGIPGLFMTGTTIYALIYYLIRYINAGQYYGLVILSLCLILLALSMLQFIPKLLRWNQLGDEYEARMKAEQSS